MSIESKDEKICYFQIILVPHSCTYWQYQMDWVGIKKKKIPWGCEGEVLRVIGKKLEGRELGLGFDSDTLYACMNAKNKFTYFCCCFEIPLMSANHCFQNCAYCSAVAYMESQSDISPDCYSGKQRWVSRQPDLSSTGISSFTCCRRQTAFSFSRAQVRGIISCVFLKNWNLVLSKTLWGGFFLYTFSSNTIP